MATRAPAGGGSGLSTHIPARYRPLVYWASSVSGVPPEVIAAQISDESGWNPDAVSPKGAEGIAQFEPGTWASWGKGSPFNPVAAFHAYGRFMRSLVRQYHGNLRDALAAYNAGPADLQAGYGYADNILAAAGASGSYKNVQEVPYRNPLRAVRNLTAEQVDQGVDYSGSGPVYALGPGVITSTTGGWPGGGFISERLTAGPLRGHYVYVAEDISPTVQVGQHVTSGTEIGQMFEGGSGIETGFAAPPPDLGQALAYVKGQANYTGDPGAHPTAYGAAYSKLLEKLGAPGGTIATKPVGGAPSWLQTALGDVGLGFLGNQAAGAAGDVTGIAGQLGRIAQVFEDLQTAINWLVNPSNWVRLACGGSGAVLVIAGLVVLSGIQAQASQSVPIVGGVAAQTQSSMRLPMGIGMVGAGGVLLFIAFHNLPAGVTNISELTGYVQQQTQAATAQAAA